MSKLIAIFIVIAAIYGVVALLNYYDEVKRTSPYGAQTNSVSTGEAPQPDLNVPPESLAGLPPGYEPSLKAAYQGGAPALGTWLKKYGRAVGDPRRASIELDYVVLLTNRDPVEAKKIFKAVKARTPANSPVYPRIKKLEKTFE